MKFDTAKEEIKLHTEPENKNSQYLFFDEAFKSFFLHKYPEFEDLEHLSKVISGHTKEIP